MTPGYQKQIRRIELDIERLVRNIDQGNRGGQERALSDIIDAAKIMRRWVDRALEDL